jgi:hypothetical protein
VMERHRSLRGMGPRASTTIEAESAFFRGERPSAGTNTCRARPRPTAVIMAQRRTKSTVSERELERGERLDQPCVPLMIRRRLAKARLHPSRSAAHRLANHVCPCAEFAHSPATCLVVTLSRFQTLIVAIEIVRAASAVSS